MTYTAQKIKFAITDFFSKCDQIHSSLRKSVVCHNRNWNRASTKKYY